MFIISLGLLAPFFATAQEEQTTQQTPQENEKQYPATKEGMLSMRKKTIGEVLRLARINQGLSLEELHRKTDIQLDLLEALETDDFDKLPSTFYARSFLRKYAWAVELDEHIILLISYLPDQK